MGGVLGVAEEERGGGGGGGGVLCVVQGARRWNACSCRCQKASKGEAMGASVSSLLGKGKSATKRWGGGERDSLSQRGLVGLKMWGPALALAPEEVVPASPLFSPAPSLFSSTPVLPATQRLAGSRR